MTTRRAALLSRAPSRELLQAVIARTPYGQASLVHAVLARSPHALTVPEVMTVTGLGRDAVLRALAALLEARQVERATLLGGKDAGDIEGWRVGPLCERRLG